MQDIYTKILKSKKFQKFGIPSILFILVASTFFIWTSQDKEAEAGWWNDSWTYRKAIEVTNNTTTESDVYIELTLDTSASSTIQSDCGDFRFTTQGGQILDYYIVSGCGTVTNVIHINFETFPAGSQTIYFYYGNSTVENGFSSSNFATEASNYTIGTVGAEEVGGGPVGYWSFDEGYGSVAHDSSSGGNDGTITGATWQDESMCVSGRCLLFSTSSDSIDLSNVDFLSLDDKISFSLWLKPLDLTNISSKTILGRGAWNYESNYVLEQKGNDLIFLFESTLGGNSRYVVEDIFTMSTWTHISISFSYGDASSIKIYKDGILKNGTWTEGDGNATPVTSSSVGFSIGHIEPTGESFVGYIDEVKIYPYARSSDQIKQDYNAGLSGVSTSKGTSVSFGSKSDSWMSDGLVGYWKFDETATTSGAIDASGNGNDGTYYGSASTTGGRFGNGGVFDGVDDYIETTNDNLKELNNFTISTWFNANNTNYAHHILWQGNNGGNGWGATALQEEMHISIGNSLGSDYSDYLSFFLGADDNWTRPGTLQVATPFTSTDSWNNVIIVVSNLNSSPKAQMYLNGELVDEDTGTVSGVTRSTWNRNLFFGKPGVSQRYFDGKIDETRVYNRALSNDEVKKLYEYAPGPVLHLKLDEKQGTTAYDTSGYGNNGSITGASWDRGKLGSALDFDGLNNYIEVPHSSSYKPALPITLSAWINARDYDSWHNIITTDTYSPNYYGAWLQIENNGKIEVSYGDGGAVGAESRRTKVGNTIIEKDKWYFVSAVLKGPTDMDIYINGTKDGGTYSGTGDDIAYTTGQLNIGRSMGVDAMFNGLIDDVKIYNYARTQKQILEDMSAGRPAQKSPIAYWKFDEGFGGTVHDSSGNENHGTASSGASGTNTTTSQMWSGGGKYGKAIELDGTDDLVDFGSFDFIDDVTEMSSCSWVFFDSLGASRRILNKYNDYGFYYGLDYNFTNTRYVFSVNDGANSTIRSNKEPSISNWNHVCVTFKANNTEGLKLYINGEEDSNSPASTIGNSQIDPEGNTLYLGNIMSRTWDGKIDEVKIFNYALTEEEIKQEYNQGFAAVLGSSGTDSLGESTNSHDVRYCVPGSSDFCAPPVGEWNFDEKTGTTAYDISGNGNDGVLGSDGAGNAPLWDRGKNNTALNFDGLNDFVDISGGVDQISDEITVSAWINSSNYSDTGWRNILSSGVSTSGNYGFQLAKGPQTGGYNLYFGIINSEDTQVYVTVNTFPSINEWHHITGTYNGEEIRMYINGELKSTNTLSGSIKHSSPIRIGSSPQNSEYWDGKIDEVKIYNYARTPAQIAWDYNQGKPVAEWRFNECEGATAHDDSGNGYHATINIGATGLQSTLGNCATANPASAWYNGRNGKVNSSLSFDGTDDYVSVGNLGTTINSISFWTKQDYLSNYFLDLDGGTNTISLSNSQVITTGITSPKIYINGIEKTNIPDNSWQHITIVTNTSINVSNMNIGRIGTDYYAGLFDEIKLFNYPLTNEQVKTNYSGGAVNFGGLAKETGSALAFRVCGDSVYNDNDSITYSTVLADDGNCWLASNLGTANIATARNDSSAYGAYYQWGRLADGHQISTSGTTATLSTTDVPGHGNFITSGSSPYDWRNPQNDNLWQDVDGINNPCPTGWRLPTQPEWSAVVSAENINNYTEAASSKLKLPAAGYRNRTSGAMYDLGSYGYYWSASPHGSSAYSLSFYSSGVYPANFSNRAHGFSVRCLKD